MAHGSHKPIGIYMRGLILGVNKVHKFMLVLEDICGVESVKALKCKTLGTSVMYIAYTYIHGIMHMQTNA